MPTSRKVAIVTGASGLIGSSICAELLAHGAAVVGLDVAESQVPGVDMIRLDVSDPQAVRLAAHDVRGKYGVVDWLVHAAALTGRTPDYDLEGDLRSITAQVWNDILRVNLTSALVCVQQFVPLMSGSPRGKIILIGSIQGLVPTHGSGGYAVAKSALVGMTRQLAAEFAADGITVNMVAPGPIVEPSEASRAAQTSGRGPTPMGRFGEPSDISSPVCNLLREPYTYLTGAIIPLDGGEHLRPRNQPALPADD
jgi:3-oxoacyl-[acyl-carrier protein] reductase